MARAKQKPKLVPGPLKLDLGCGPNKKGPEWIGCDQYAFPGVDRRFNIGKDRWPFADGSVEEAHASHVVEHLTPEQRCHFVNELWRVLQPGGKCQVVVPSWSSNRAYGDPTHQWPAVSEFWFFYLSKEWRAGNAPHTDAKLWPPGFKCDFEATWGYGLHPSLSVRNQEYQSFALNNYINAASDIIATLTAKK